MIDNLLAMLKRPTRPRRAPVELPAIKVPGRVLSAPRAPLEAFAYLFEVPPTAPIKGVTHGPR